eukprot:Blabericola_migrator_1__10563@NODE_5_length_29060_cov_171_088642_g4_i0_p8_GENE_NODE_5_length_29060_cov_171_088642_g4_i0NODE_5_length_29060_cov_171_088642_g4_i0_p8_ORF_typecomplete_len411_score42_04KH_1/PF00013_29/3_7e09KH_5/PF13184_6/0_046KH_2/PF07650_17/0_04_NODE_5_length_29060_cov_171_088642_g4_i02476225994
MPNIQVDVRTALPPLMPEFVAVEPKNEEAEKWSHQITGFSDGPTVSSPSDRKADLDDTCDAPYIETLKEDSLAPQTTEDFVGESLKRDLDLNPHRPVMDFPIKSSQMEWKSLQLNDPPAFPYQLDSQSDQAYVKLLLKSNVADKLCILVRSNEQVIALMEPCHLQLSSPNCFFPGTRDRVLSVRAQELRHVLAVVRFISRLVSDAAASHGISLRESKPELKIAVPRKVIGTIIGRGGSHIQQLRHNTMAHIHISPIFVPSEAACGERVISIVSRDHSSLFRAAEMVISKIHEHPDHASCRRVVYYQHTSASDPWQRRQLRCSPSALTSFGNLSPSPTISTHASTTLTHSPKEELISDSPASCSPHTPDAKPEVSPSRHWNLLCLIQSASFWQVAVWLYIISKVFLYIFQF